jgi:predicted  nucleic acid-binding Zn-ribbon protein
MPAAPAVSEANFPADAAAFQDRLVLRLWQSHYAARERARRLIAGMRTAQTRIAELEAAIAGIEAQLARESAQHAAEATDREAQVARLESDLAAAHADRQHIAAELEALRTARQRTGPPDPRLQALADELTRAQHEVAELRHQLVAQEAELESIRAQAEAAEADRRAEAEQFAATQESARNYDEELAAERAGWEQQRAAADADADRLREQLYACEMQIAELRGQAAEADAARAAVAEQLTTAQQQQSQWLAECQTLQDRHAATLAELTAERDGLQHQLEQLAASLSQHGAFTTPTDASLGPVVDWSIPADAAPVTAAEETTASERSRNAWATSEPNGDNVAPESSRATIVDAVPRAASAPAERSRHEEAHAPQKPAPTTEQSWRAQEPGSLPAPPAADEPPAEPYAPTSFIDKYRHLLEESGDAEPSPRLSRPTLDDEYQSTRTSATPSPAEEDTDEALEAYMSNLMRRVRGDGSSAAVAAAAAAARFLESPPEVAATETVAPSVPEGEVEPEIEIDANGMLRLARKPPAMSTDLSAMRELANNSARTAIARHRQRRHAELALSKGVICLLASGASAFLMMTAPSMQSPWFWVGCATLAGAAVTGVQLVVLGCQRARDGRARRRAARFFQDECGSATSPAPNADASPAG